MRKKLSFVCLFLALLMLAMTVLPACGEKPEETKPETTAQTEPETVAETHPETKPETVAETEPETIPETEPETEAPETKAPETKAPETKAPETKAPETKAPETKAPETKAPETEAPKMELLTPANGSMLDLLTEDQHSFLNMDRSKMTVEELRTYRKENGIGEKSVSPRIYFTWKDVTKDGYVLEVSETPDFADPTVAESRKATNYVMNLKVGTTYYWRVNGCEPFTFTTMQSPRFLNINGITNFRDIGGYTTVDGKTIRQDKMYRGGKPEGISKTGIQSLVGDLGLKTEIDLRAVGENNEILKKSGVKIVYVTMHGVYSTFFEKCPKQVKYLFDMLADESNYPFYIHCAGGADRTGCMVFLLESLLGMSEEDLINDYELTTIANVGALSRNNAEGFAPFYEQFLSLEGETLSEKAEGYLINDCGVTAETIAKIKAIMLED